jgi:D-ribulokinase
MEVVIGLDIGTSGAKALAVDRSGQVQVRAECAFAHPPYQPAPGRAEQDAAAWWQAGAACLTELTATLPDAQVMALSVDSTSGTIVPVDAAGDPLMPAMMYNDGRAQGLETRVNAAAVDLSAKLGYRFSATFALVKLCWLQQQHPDLVAQTHKFLHAADFVVGTLTGNLNATDTSNALKSGVDLLDGTWPTFIETELGLPLTKFPAVYRPGEQVGEVSAHAAAATGLRAGTPVVAGASDGTAAFLASGAKHPGDWNLNIGTTIAIRGIASTLIRDPHGRLYCHRHPEGLWLPGGASNVGGEALRAVFGADHIDAFDQAVDLNQPSPLIVYPLQRTGERMPFAHGTAQGFTLGDTDNDIARFQGYLEGIALITAWSVQEASALGAETGGDFFFSGGAARGHALKHILASALERSLQSTREPDAAFGSALLAAGWAWFDGSVSRAQAALVQIAQQIDPVPALIKPLHAKLKELKTACRQRGYL